jgi:tRNA dimethylallyltransferase
MENKIPLVAIVGPTATGKTEAAIQTALSMNGEIISADSMQIYKYMDIGTAKPSREEMRGIPHHMMDCIDPAEEFSVARYQTMAKHTIKEVHKKGKLPILVGGTGLYVNSIVYPMAFTEAQVDNEYRKQLQQMAEEKGNIAVYRILQESDPLTAEKLHPNDIRRVIRALEVKHLTGREMSDFRQDFSEPDLMYDLIMIGMTMDRQRLYRRINSRVDIMLEKGLLDEVKWLLEMGYSKDLTSMQGLGYKELIRYLEGDISLEEAVEILKRDTRRYAKRQLTWFRRESRIEWLNLDQIEPGKEIQWIISHIEKNLSSSMQTNSI